MKKIKKKQDKKRKRIVLTLIIFIIVVLLAIYIFVFKGEILGFSVKKNSDSSKTVSDPAAKKQIKASEQSKKGPVNSKSSSEPNKGSDQPLPVQPPAGGETKGTVSMIVSAANQNGSTVQIRLLIETLVSSGTCSLTGTSASGKSIQKDASVQPQSTTSTCTGFDIPVNELSQEDWNFKINFENNDVQGSATTEISVK